MRVAVLLVSPPQASLMESARSLHLEGVRSTRFLLEADTPRNFVPNLRRPAVPMSSGRSFALETLREPERAEHFVVAGQLEVDSMEQVPEEIDGKEVFLDIPIHAFTLCAGSAPFGNIADVQRKLRVPALQQRRLDGHTVGVVVMDNGINLAHLQARLGANVQFDRRNSWNADDPLRVPGNAAVGHGTMCAHAVLSVAPRATLIDYPIIGAPSTGGTATTGSIGLALLAYARITRAWGVQFAVDDLSKYTSLVITNSWGLYDSRADLPPGHRGRYCDNPRHPFNMAVRNLAEYGVDIVFAAGNCGADCALPECNGRIAGSIMGANALEWVLTVAGCDTNDQRVGYSSQGPAIQNMPQHKPDIAAFTHFLGSEALGTGKPDWGTSTAAPIAAGCVAALRSRVTPQTVLPAVLFDHMRNGARQVSGAGWNQDYGHGILDPVNTATRLGLL